MLCVMSISPSVSAPVSKGRKQREGLTLLVGIVALMWVVEVINTLDSNNLGQDGLHPRDLDRFGGSSPSRSCTRASST